MFVHMFVYTCAPRLVFLHVYATKSTIYVYTQVSLNFRTRVYEHKPVSNLFSMHTHFSAYVRTRVHTNVYIRVGDALTFSFLGTS